MLCIGGADNLLSLDYHTIIHMQRMRVKTFLQKISKNFLSNFTRKNRRNSPEKISLENSPEKFSPGRDTPPTRGMHYRFSTSAA